MFITTGGNVAPQSPPLVVPSGPVSPISPLPVPPPSIIIPPRELAQSAAYAGGARGAFAQKRGGVEQPSGLPPSLPPSLVHWPPVAAAENVPAQAHSEFPLRGGRPGGRGNDLGAVAGAGGMGAEGGGESGEFSACLLLLTPAYSFDSGVAALLPSLLSSPLSHAFFCLLPSHHIPPLPSHHPPPHILSRLPAFPDPAIVLKPPAFHVPTTFLEPP
ncbi:unnamed protein product [Closterium sp. Naga37s-1]|nr:unnamed protein product [Closterium sp. Naga37s-1]